MMEKRFEKADNFLHPKGQSIKASALLKTGADKFTTILSQ